MSRGRTLAAAGAALALITGAGVAVAATTAETATCTASPTITDDGVSQSIDVTCSWPKPAAETVTSTVTSTVTQTATATQTVTASPPVTTTTPAATTSSTTTPAPTTTTVAPAAWPDASTTGVPAGTVLTNRAGGTLSTPGQVINGANFTGTVRITANNVVIRNSRITGSGYDVVKIVDGLVGVRLERVEIDGKGKSGTSGSNGIYGDGTFVGVNIHGVENGIQPNGDGGTVLRDSWIHDLDAPGSPHIDGVQIDGGRSNITVEHNVVDIRPWTQTAAVMIDNYFGPVNNVTVNNNRLLGGSYTTYIDAMFGRTKPADDTGGGPITNVRYTNNRIGYGQFGPASIRTDSRDSYTWSGNVTDSTSQPIASP